MTATHQIDFENITCSTCVLIWTIGTEGVIAIVQNIKSGHRLERQSMGKHTSLTNQTLD